MAESKSKSNPNPADAPKAVVGRLSLYLRELQHLVRDGHETISSTRLGKILGFSDAQVRKDLAYFGQFGYPGIGYRCHELIHAIKQIFGTDRQWPVAIIGTGNLGRALVGYKGFDNQGFKIVAAFDIDPAKVGGAIEEAPIYHLNDLERIVQEKQIKLAIIAVPASAAQSVADRLGASGIDGILNFAPVTVTAPPNASMVGVDLAIEMEQLTFDVVKRSGEKK